MVTFSLSIRKDNALLEFPIPEHSPYLTEKAVSMFNTPFSLKKIKINKDEQFDVELVKQLNGQISVLAVAFALNMPICKHNKIVSSDKLSSPITEVYLTMNTDDQKITQQIPIIMPILTTDITPNPVAVWINVGIANPVIDFANAAKRGDFNDLSDSEYERLLNIEHHASMRFKDATVEQLMIVAIRHAQMIAQFSSITLDEKHIAHAAQICAMENQPIQLSIEFVNDDKKLTLPLIIDDQSYTKMEKLIDQEIDVSKLNDSDKAMYKRYRKRISKKHAKHTNILALSLFLDLDILLRSSYVQKDYEKYEPLFKNGSLWRKDNSRCTLIITNTRDNTSKKYAISDTECMLLNKKQKRILTALFSGHGPSKMTNILNPNCYKEIGDAPYSPFIGAIIGKKKYEKFGNIVVNHATIINDTNAFFATEEMCTAVQDADKTKETKKSGSSQIQEFLEKVPFDRFYELTRLRVRGQDNQLKAACFYVYRWLQYIALSDDKKPSRHKKHFIITGQSGCGKTEFARTIIDILKKHGLDIPMTIINTSNVTPTGWKGMDATQAIRCIFDQDRRGRGIVVLDEIDKMIASEGWHGDKRTTAYLSMLDGDFIEFENDKSSSATIVSAQNLLIIGTGSFSALRNEREENESDIGFTASTANKKEAYAKNITLDDLSDKYNEPEFIGRFTDVINFNSITRRDLLTIVADNIITYIMGNPDVFDMTIDDIIEMKRFEMSPKAKKQLYKAAESKRGVRAAISLMEKAFNSTVIKYQLKHDKPMGKLTGIVVNDFEKPDVRLLKRRKVTTPDATDEEKSSCIE